MGFSAKEDRVLSNNSNNNEKRSCSRIDHATDKSNSILLQTIRKTIMNPIMIVIVIVLLIPKPTEAAGRAA